MIRFSLEGQQQLVRQFKGISMAGKNFTSAFKKIGRDLTDTFSGPVFDTEGAEIGEKWKTGPKYHGLVRTGKMRKSFRFKAGKDYVIVDNIVDYFKFHQSIRPRYKLPRRIMMKIDDKRKVNIMKRLHKHIFRTYGLN